MTSWPIGDVSNQSSPRRKCIVYGYLGCHAPLRMQLPTVPQAPCRVHTARSEVARGTQEHSAGNDSSAGGVHETGGGHVEN